MLFEHTGMVQCKAHIWHMKAICLGDLCLRVFTDRKTVLIAANIHVMRRWCISKRPYVYSLALQGWQVSYSRKCVSKRLDVYLRECLV